MRGCSSCAPQASYLRAEALLPLVGLMPQKDMRERLQRAGAHGRMDGHAP